jgi:hypothetical protein
LTDYAMPPGETGASMLRRAESGGHLRDVAAIMYTSAESPERLPDVRLVPKGSDLSVLLRAMDDALSRVREEDMRRTRESLEQRTSRASALGTPVARVELVLYVSASSPLSHRALQQLKNLLSEYDESSIDAVVRDLAHDPAAADADGVAFTPTLVVRRPGPPEWFLGDLREPDVLRDRFAAAGVKRRVLSVESEGGARGGP